MLNESEIHSIIAEVNSGNTQAFARLVDEYKHMVYSLCMKMAQNQEDAEEIAQDSFVKAYKGLRKFKGKSKFSTWLYQLTYFTAINHLRKKKLTIEDQFHLMENEMDESTQQPLELADKKRFIHASLKHLNTKERALINLFYLEELDLSEVAEIMKMSMSNVKVSVHRARKKLYAIMHHLLKDELNSLLHES